MKYTKEEISSKVIVPPSVEIELKRLIESKLRQTGVFCRVFSRIKTASSLEHKFQLKEYNEEKKIQDLIGIRINLYFQDDLKIVKQLMRNLFVEIEWTQEEFKENVFEPRKINGVFRLPSYLVAKISDSTWDIPIDQAFEIQLKTVFFEGWHEVEHDIRYKNQKLWEPYGSYARRFNSVLATLELCDKSIVDISEDLAHSLYKAGDFEGMIRMHFRIRISNQKIYEEFIPILEANQKELGKKLLRYERRDLIEYLSNFYRDIPISVNMIIALINDRDFQNEEIKEIARAHRVYHDGKSDLDYERRRRELRKLSSYPVFNNQVTIDVFEDNKYAVYQRVTDHIYGWMCHKFQPIFDTLPNEKQSIKLRTDGFQIESSLSENEFTMTTSHMDQAIAGRIWHTYACVKLEDTTLRLTVLNEMKDIEEITEEERINNFSAPGFFSEICRDNSISVRDIRRMSEAPKIIKGEKNPELHMFELICDEKRFSPVAVIVYDKTEDGGMDKSWLTPYWATDLTRAVKYCAHVYESYEIDAGPISDIIGDATLRKGVYLFKPKSPVEVKFYSEEDITNWKHTPGDNGIMVSRNTEGNKAFINDFVREIKRINITSMT